MTESNDWNQLARDWQSVDVQNTDALEAVLSLKWRTRLMLLNTIIEVFAVIAVAALLIFLLGFLPASSPLIIWAVFGVLLSAVAVYFRFQNSRGLWAGNAESTVDMLQLSRSRLKAIEGSARINRALCIAFAIALPLWTAWALVREPQLLLRNPLITALVYTFAVAWIGLFWYFSNRTVRQSPARLAAIERLLEEFRRD